MRDIFIVGDMTVRFYLVPEISSKSVGNHVIRENIVIVSIFDNVK